MSRFSSSTFRRLAATACLASAVAGTGQAQPKPHQEFICILGSVTRVVSIFNRDESTADRKIAGCRVDYTKDGQTKTAWSSTTDSAYCVARALALVRKLGEGHFTCKPDTVEQTDEPAPLQPVPGSNKPLQPSVTH